MRFISNLGHLLLYYFVIFVDGNAREGGDAMDGCVLGEAATLTFVRYFFSGLS